jgi:hypothetical protein
MVTKNSSTNWIADGKQLSNSMVKSPFQRVREKTTAAPTKSNARTGE